MTVNLGGKLIDISSPIVMSIINFTPDSFYSRSRNTEQSSVAGKIAAALEDGAVIIDIGGCSTRPDAAEVSCEEECRRVCETLCTVRKEFGQINISIDTFRSDVVRAAYDEYGPVIVNDVTAGLGDERMIDTVSEFSLPYIAMHMRGTPQTMRNMTDYDDVVNDIIKYFVERLEVFSKKGIKDVILDAGFGFAKTVEQNFELLRRHDELKVLGKPLLAGISRKTMIWKTLGVTPEEALNGTTALHWEALLKGANILRAHDTREAVETIKLFEACYGKNTK